MSFKSKIKLLDRIFSQYIRFRDTDKNGYGKCISSGKIIHYNDSDAGHYVNRKHMSLRYSESNVNIQSRSDNRFDEGNMSGYTLGLEKKYGKGIIETLNRVKNISNKLTEFELKVMIDHYRGLNKQFNKSFKVDMI